MRYSLATLCALAVFFGTTSPVHSAEEVTRYFGGAILKVNPAKPLGEITSEEAASLESAGFPAYYIATYDSLGRILSLEKRLRGTTFFRYTYEYPNGEPVRTDLLAPPAE